MGPADNSRGNIQGQEEEYSIASGPDPPSNATCRQRYLKMD